MSKTNGDELYSSSSLFIYSQPNPSRHCAAVHKPYRRSTSDDLSNSPAPLVAARHEPYYDHNTTCIPSSMLSPRPPTSIVVIVVQSAPTSCRLVHYFLPTTKPRTLTENALEISYMRCFDPNDKQQQALLLVTVVVRPAPTNLPPPRLPPPS